MVGDPTGPVTSAAPAPSSPSAPSSAVCRLSQLSGFPSASTVRERFGSKSASTSASAKASVAPRLAGCAGLPCTLVGRP